MTATSQVATMAARMLRDRNAICEAFFAEESGRLAVACDAMSRRFLSGGRLLALGRGAYVTDAQHVSVEFVHPVIVGKRALPAFDISHSISCLAELVRPADIVMGFGPPSGDPKVAAALQIARREGAMTFALPGRTADYAAERISTHPLLHQEIIEILYHTLWETVHVFFERTTVASEGGDAGFLYPFLGGGNGDFAGLAREVAESIRMKVAEDSRLRRQVADEQAGAIIAAAHSMASAVRSGSKLLLFGNGGSATDANDWALDCIAPPPGMRPVPALSLSADPAILTAIANDVGFETVYLRQLAAHGQPGDVAIAISTSGASRNLIAALEEARRRGLVTVALLGYDGGEIVRRRLADHAIVVPSDYVPRIQEVQASVYHVIRELLETLGDA